jgi:hypothetical protein
MISAKPEENLAYATEFKERPIGPHSPGLQRLLNIFRADTRPPRLAAFAIKPHAEWVIIRLPETRSAPIEIERDRVFTSLEDAEWEVFCRRWELHFGRDIRG